MIYLPVLVLLNSEGVTTDWYNEKVSILMIFSVFMTFIFELKVFEFVLKIVLI